MEHRTTILDSARVSVPENQRGFPALVEHYAQGGTEAFLDFWAAERTRVEGPFRRQGALLFRGFGIDSQEAFEQVMAHLQTRLLTYVDGNSPRTKLGRGVYTSTEYPPEYFISLHNELSYSARWPGRLFFCCVTPPNEGGETALTDSRALLLALPEPLVDEFRRKQVRYIRNLHGGKGFGPSWQKTFETPERSVVEEYARESGLDLDWLTDGTARLTNVRPATARHPLTGEELWFNQADQFHPSTHPEPVYRSMIALYKGREHQLPQNATFGDGGAIPLAHLNAIRETTRARLALFQWQKGDLLMVDNMLMAHGRMPFKGPRKILVSMTAE
jgi:alpha-ketoglutarate-dependent taurine dioxygenase